MQSDAAVLDDSILLRDYASSGDAAAFAELVRRYADMVYATARRVTGSAAAAEDVAQDCFLRLAQGSAAVRGSLAAWLHRTSLNRSLEIVRAEQARKRREGAAAAGAVHSSSGGDESRELIAHVDEALAALPDELRGALTEHFFCGRSQAEMAAAGGVNQSTISRRIQAGVENLRAKLREQGALPASLMVLPAFLDSSVREAAPHGLRAGLAKIGLSGVRALPTAASATAGAGHVLLTAGSIASATLVAALVAGGVWFAVHATRHGPGAANSTTPATTAAGVKVNIDQLPKAVRDTFDSRAKGATLNELERRTEAGRTIYEADAKVGGKNHEIQVAEDGKLVSDKIEDERIDLDLK